MGRFRKSNRHSKTKQINVIMWLNWKRCGERKKPSQTRVPLFMIPFVSSSVTGKLIPCEENQNRGFSGEMGRGFLGRGITEWLG